MVGAAVLGYAPFPMNLRPIKLGLVLFGWGVLVAIFAVFGAPRLQARFGRPVASAAYSFVRFIGGGLAQYAAGRLVIALNIHVPF